MHERIVYKNPQVLAMQRQTAKLHMAFKVGETIRTRMHLVSPNLPKIEEYNDPQKLLGAYREVRRIFAPEFTEVLRSEPLSAQRVEAQVLREQEAVRREILLSINNGSNVLSADTMRQATQSDVAFASFLQTLVQQEPQMVAVIPDVLHVTIPQEFKAELQRYRQEHEMNFGLGFANLARFFEPQEIKEIVKNMVSNSMIFTSVFFSRDVKEQFMQDGKATEEGKALFRQAMKQDTGEMILSQELDTAVTEGFISLEEVQDAALSYLKSTDLFRLHRKTRIALGAAKYFPGDAAAILQEEVRGLVKTEMSVSEAYEAADFLGQKSEDVVGEAKKRFMSQIFSEEEIPGGYGAITYLKEELAGLTEEEVQTYIHRYKILRSFGDIAFLLEKGLLAHDEKKRIADALLTELPTVNGFMVRSGVQVGERLFDSFSIREASVNVLQELLSAYSEDTKVQSDTVMRLVGTTDSRRAFSSIDQWISYIPESERASYIYEYIRGQENPSFEFVASYIGDPTGVIARLFSREEIINLVREVSTRGARDFSELGNIRTVFADDKEFRLFLEQVGEQDPITFVSGALGLMGDIFTSQEVKALILTFSENHEEVVEDLFATIEQWAPLFVVNGDSAFVRKFIAQNKLRAGEGVLDNLHGVIRYIEEADQTQFIRETIAINPAKAMQLFLLGEKSMQLGLSYEQIVEIGANALEDYSKNFAPKSLTEFYAKLQNIGDTPARQALLANTEEVYRAIARIRAAGLEETFFAAQQGAGTIDGYTITPAVEKELLFVFETYAHFMRQDPKRFTLDIAKNMRSLDFAVNLLVEKIGEDILGRSPTGDEIYDFHGAVENPMALFVYYMKYGSTETHKEMLQTMMRSLFEGKEAYGAWRFGEPTVEGFEQAKPFLPMHMTYDQYLIWRNERRTSLRDVLAADKTDVQHAVQKLMRQKRKQLHFALQEHEVMPFSAESLESVQAAIQSNGQALAKVNKELGPLRKQASISTRVTELEEERTGLMQRQEALVHDRKVFRLALIAANEVVEGNLLEGKSKGPSIASLLADLKRYEEEHGTQEGALAYSEIEQYFLGYSQQTSEEVNLEAFDTANVRLTMEIGRKPVGSCQDFAHGAYNQCLVGYTNQNVKPMFLAISGRDSLVARNIERVMDTSDGRVGIHMERIYSASASPLVDVAMYEHAMKIAEEMGVEIYTSVRAQNEQGQTVAAVAPKGFRYEEMPDDFYLVSPERSRAPWQYVDSGGGPQKGQFKLAMLCKIVRDDSQRSGSRR